LAAGREQILWDDVLYSVFLAQGLDEQRAQTTWNKVCNDIMGDTERELGVNHVGRELDANRANREPDANRKPGGAGREPGIEHEPRDAVHEQGIGHEQGVQYGQRARRGRDARNEQNRPYRHRGRKQ
jgi:hypothetical protein